MAHAKVSPANDVSLAHAVANGSVNNAKRKMFVFKTNVKTAALVSWVITVITLANVNQDMVEEDANVEKFFLKYDSGLKV